MNTLKHLIKPLCLNNLICRQSNFKGKVQLRCFKISSFEQTKVEISSSPLRRKTRSLNFDKKKKFQNVVALSTADSYNLEELSDAVLKQNIYELINISEEIEEDVLPLRAKYKVNDVPRDIFIFREGSLVCWNCAPEEIDNLLEFVSNFQHSPYEKSLVIKEKEEVDYIMTNEIPRSKIIKGTIYLKNDDKTKLYDQYACSNAIAMSVKLAIWESLLNCFIEKIQPISENMKQGKNLKLSREDMFKRTGELFTLRHQINLQSDLLDTPDFYWDRNHLEHLYQKIFNFLKLSKRTKVMNEKINDCLSLIELVSHHLDDKHHVRLEWMIIILIMVEVGFEVLHYSERYYSTGEIED